MLIISVLLLLFAFLFFNFRQPCVSSYDRQISVLTCIKYNNHCTNQDLTTIQNMCFILLKDSNIFPKEANFNDIVNACYNKDYKMYPHIYEMHSKYYGINTINLLENKYNLVKFINEKYPELV